MQTLHPLFVHFPIALLTLYVGLEFLSLFKKFSNNKTLFYMKAILLILGSISASIAASTGEGAEQQLIRRSMVTMRHSLFADITTNIFWVLAVIYIIKLILDEYKNYKLFQKIPSALYALLARLMTWIDKLYVPFILSLAGLFAVSITGALGGAIVHGPQIDPFVQRSVDTFATGTLPAKSFNTGANQDN